MAIITISRGTYSAGKIIAEKLAARLGYPCASQEIIFDAAKDFGIPETELNAALIKPPGFLKLVPGKRIAILNVIRTALLTLSRGGNLVYHGFAGHLLLREVSHVLKARVIASMDYRIQVAMTRHGDNLDQAIARIRRRDKQSIYWSRFLYGVDWQDTTLYDVILNLERISIDGAVETLMHMIELEEFKPTEASRQAFEDLLLGSRVWAELTKDPRTRSANVRVEARLGHVTVTGDAGSEQVIKALSEVAESVAGVQEVSCDVGIGSNWFW
jgi:cytidylate kinase